MALLDFNAALQQLDAYGLTQLFLPFILIFTVLFAILQKVKIFKEGEEPNKKVNAVISLVISLLTVIPHVTGGYPSGYDVVTIINSILPGSMLILVTIIMFLMLIGLAGGGTSGTNYTAIIALIATLGLSYVIWTSVSPGSLPQWLSFLQDPGLQSLIIILIVAGLIISYIVSDGGGGGDTVGKGLDNIKKLIYG